MSHVYVCPLVIKLGYCQILKRPGKPIAVTDNGGRTVQSVYARGRAICTVPSDVDKKLTTAGL